MLILPAVEAEDSSRNGWFDSCSISIVIDHIVPWQGHSASQDKLCSNAFVIICASVSSSVKKDARAYPWEYDTAYVASLKCLEPHSHTVGAV